MAALSRAQLCVLVGVGLLLWGVAAACIRFAPAALATSAVAAVVYAATVPIGWASVWLAKAAGPLSPGQLLPGVSVVGAVAMMLDGLVLRWAPGVYGAEEAAVRMGAAWLLWGYGVSLAIALAWTWRKPRGG